MERFGFGSLSDELNGPKVHRLENVMTLEPTVHGLFDQMKVWFTATVRSTSLGSFDCANLLAPIRAKQTHISLNGHRSSTRWSIRNKSHSRHGTKPSFLSHLQLTLLYTLHVPMSLIYQERVSVLKSSTRIWRQVRRLPRMAPLHQCWNTPFLNFKPVDRLVTISPMR